MSFVRRARCDRLPLPLSRPAAHPRSPEKLTLLNKGGQLPLSDIQQLLHNCTLRGLFGWHLIPLKPSFLSPPVTSFLGGLEPRVCTGAYHKCCSSLEGKQGLSLDGGRDSFFLSLEGQSSLGNALLPPNMHFLRTLHTSVSSVLTSARGRPLIAFMFY